MQKISPRGGQDILWFQQSIEGQRKIVCQVYFIESAQFQLRMCMRHAESLYARNGVRPAHWISNIYFPSSTFEFLFLQAVFMLPANTVILHAEQVIDVGLTEQTVETSLTTDNKYNRE